MIQDFTSLLINFRKNSISREMTVSYDDSANTSFKQTENSAFLSDSSDCN